MSKVSQHPIQISETVTLSESAKRQVLLYLGRQAGCNGIRLSVKKTGCSGMSYVIDYVNAPEQDDMAEALDDMHWIYVDKKSYPYLKGVHMDYVKQGLNYKMVFTNPNQTGQCGCGESFTVDA